MYLHLYFENKCAVLNMADTCSSLISCFPSLLLRYCLLFLLLPPPLLLLLLLLTTDVFSFHRHYSPLWALACRTTSFHFFPTCHQLSPSSHSQHLKISFYFLFPPFPGSSASSCPFQFLSEDLFGHPILLHSL